MQLSRRLGFWSSVGFVIGMTIGSGIFRTPAQIAARVPDPTLMLAVWVLGGVVTLCGALSMAELASSLPQAGGFYVFIREAWGRPAAFVFTWSELVLIRAAGLSGIATVFGEYFLRSLGYDPLVHAAAADYCAIAGIVVATLANVRGVQTGALMTGVTSAAKFAALALIAIAAIIFGSAAGASFAHFAPSSLAPSDAPSHAAPSHLALFSPGLFGLAFISVLWAYDGFGDLSFLAGEVRDPERTLPRAIIGGTLAIIAIYLTTNAAFMYVLPIETVAKSPLIAADTMSALVGPIGASFVSIAVAISTFGAVNSDLLGAPRLFYAAAEDGLFFKTLGRVHPRYRTPYISILFSAALGIVFVLTGTFEQIADTFVLAIWPFYGLAVAGLYRLRRRTDLARPYRVPGYPIVPAIFIAACVYLVASALIGDPLWTGVTLGIVLAGLPVYYLTFARRGTTARPRSPIT
ncbi:MAG TPA: amino acid permease [Vicinamibacterales bacterium]|jgi:basic amino acid/polyamine antiporter, APA family|nr:amino acid permease [Vicinamibacterales bacterium]